MKDRWCVGNAVNSELDDFTVFIAITQNIVIVSAPNKRIRAEVISRSAMSQCLLLCCGVFKVLE